MIDEVQAIRRVYMAASVASTTAVMRTLNHAKTALSRGPSKTIEIPTGLKTLDFLTGGLNRSELVVLASWPGNGKTALALNIADHVAVEARIPILYATGQTTSVEIAERLVCARGRISHQAMKLPRLSSDNRRRLTQATSELNRSPFYVVDNHFQAVSGIHSIARRFNERYGQRSRLGLIVVDQVQALRSVRRTCCGFERIEIIIDELKSIAKKLNVAVLLLCQLDWPPVSHREATEGNLRAVANGADKVLLLHRDDKKAWLGLVRPTDIAPTTIPLVWQSDYLRFIELGEKAGLG